MRAIVLLILIYLSSCTPKPSPTKEEEKKEHELLEVMGYYQRFSHKLWYAGNAKNWELADFYAHELEEITEELIENRVMHDSMDISIMAKSILKPNLDILDKAIDQKDTTRFLDGYKLMISSCNTCHQATGHGFINIVKPYDYGTFNQDFKLSSP